VKQVAQLVENNVMPITANLNMANTSQSLRYSVQQSLQQYFSQLGGHTPNNLYEMVLSEVEKPMLEMVLQLCNNNQCKATKMLGLSRGTLRKKMAKYDLL